MEGREKIFTKGRYEEEIGRVRNNVRCNMAGGMVKRGLRRTNERLGSKEYEGKLVF
jgi:hypothetical protein